MNTITLAYVVSTLRRTGPTKQLYYLIKHLDPIAFRPHLITLSSEPDDSLFSEFISLDLTFHSLGLGRLRGLFLARHRLLEVLKRIQPGVIHTQGFRPDLLSRSLHNYPCRISTQRNNPREEYPTLYGGLIGRWMASKHCSVLREIPHVVACSESLSKHNLENDMLSTFIRNGVELNNNLKTITRSEPTELRRALRLPERGLLFLYAGPLIDRKNPLFLINAFLAHAPQDSSLCLVGNGPLLSRCRNHAKDYTNIILPGHVTNVSDYLLAADFFVSASLSEGLPNAVLEAVSMGVPVILSDIPAHREIVGLSSRIGNLFRLNNVEQLGNLLNLPKASAETRQAVAMEAKNLFSAKSMASAYQDMYINSWKASIRSD